MQPQEIWLQKALDFAKHHHETDRTGHGFDHIKRVYENACSLLQETPQADSFIVKMAALLHDIDDRKLNFGEKLTEKFLKEIQIPSDQIPRIIETIDAIDFGATGSSPHFDTLEAAVLFDADKLDAMGSIGMWRAFIYGYSINRPLFLPDLFPKKDLTKEEYKRLDRPDDTTIGHFFDKLLKLHKIMQTKSGQAEAAKRHKIMVDFLREFFREQNQPAWTAYLDDYLATLEKTKQID